MGFASLPRSLDRFTEGMINPKLYEVILRKSFMAKLRGWLI